MASEILVWPGEESRLAEAESEVEWHVIGDNPLLALLPVIWPFEDVRWRPNLEQRVVRIHSLSKDWNASTRMATPEDRYDRHDSLYHQAAELGVEPPSLEIGERIWLLRAPSRTSVEAELKRLVELGGRDGGTFFRVTKERFRNGW